LAAEIDRFVYCIGRLLRPQCLRAQHSAEYQERGNAPKEDAPHSDLTLRWHGQVPAQPRVAVRRSVWIVLREVQTRRGGGGSARTTCCGLAREAGPVTRVTNGGSGRLGSQCAGKISARGPEFSGSLRRLRPLWQG